MTFRNKSAALGRMRRIPQEMKTEISKAVEKAGDQTAEHIRFAAPEDDGHLKDSVGVRDITTPYRIAVRISAGSVQAFYARMVEFGTLFQRAQPFFYPSIRAERRRNKSLIARAARKGLNKALRRTGQAGPRVVRRRRRN